MTTEVATETTPTGADETAPTRQDIADSLDGVLLDITFERGQDAEIEGAELSAACRRRLRARFHAASLPSHEEVVDVLVVLVQHGSVLHRRGDEKGLHFFRLPEPEVPPAPADPEPAEPEPRPEPEPIAPAVAEALPSLSDLGSVADLERYLRRVEGIVGHPIRRIYRTGREAEWEADQRAAGKTLPLDHVPEAERPAWRDRARAQLKATGKGRGGLGVDLMAARLYQAAKGEAA